MDDNKYINPHIFFEGHLTHNDFGFDMILIEQSELLESYKLL